VLFNALGCLTKGEPLNKRLTTESSPPKFALVHYIKKGFWPSSTLHLASQP